MTAQDFLGKKNRLILKYCAISNDNLSYLIVR